MGKVYYVYSEHYQIMSLNMGGGRFSIEPIIK